MVAWGLTGWAEADASLGSVSVATSALARLRESGRELHCPCSTGSM